MKTVTAFCLILCWAFSSYGQNKELAVGEWKLDSITAAQSSLGPYTFLYSEAKEIWVYKANDSVQMCYYVSTESSPCSECAMAKYVFTGNAVNYDWSFGHKSNGDVVFLGNTMIFSFASSSTGTFYKRYYSKAASGVSLFEGWPTYQCGTSLVLAARKRFSYVNEVEAKRTYDVQGRVLNMQKFSKGLYSMRGITVDKKGHILFLK